MTSITIRGNTTDVGNTSTFEQNYGKLRTALKERANAPQGLTRSLDSTKEGLAMNATRLSGNDTRRTADHPHADLAEAVSVSRFWRLVDRRGFDECWPFMGYVDRNGYGVFTDTAGRRRRAHELALSYTTGEARHPDLETCHSCDNPPCCNPNHLRFDTAQANTDDKKRRGRDLRGSRAPNTKLTEQDILTIRERRALGARHKDLAIDFGITTAAVTAIVHGKNWAHVGGPITNRGIHRTRKEAGK